MDLITRAELKMLMQPGPEGTYISLFMPTHRFGKGVEGDQLRWKNLVVEVETLLLKRMRRPDVEALVAPARDLLNDTMAWQYMSDGLAVFLSPEQHRIYRVAAPMMKLATVGSHWVLGPLLRLFSGDERFLLLALSQHEVRLLECSRNTVEQVQLSGFPTSLEDAVDPQEPRSDTMTRAAAPGGRGGPAVFFGHSGDRQIKQEAVKRFLRAVSDGLHEILAGETAPLVLFGLEHLVVTYREVTNYQHLLGSAVLHNADELSIDQLHRGAWPLVEQHLKEVRGQVIERFKELGGTGRVSSDLATIAAAAADGRVETLFVKADPWCWELVESNPLGIVALGDDAEYAECEKVDLAAALTIENGGRVYATSQTVVADSQVAAIFRY